MLAEPDLQELMNRVSSATPMQRLSHAEQRVVFTWLFDSGLITFTGKPLERSPVPQKPTAYTVDGQPIWSA